MLGFSIFILAISRYYYVQGIDTGVFRVLSWTCKPWFPLDIVYCFLCSVLLRQNPHNVHEWHKRVKLYEGKPKEIINTYTEAVQTVDAKLASGKPHTLWVEFAKFYEQHGQLAEARVIFDKATKVNYRKVDDLASVWCEFSEMEIRHE